MNIRDALDNNNIGKQVVRRLSQLPDGEGLTKRDLAEMFGCTNGTTVERWMRMYPDIIKHRVYLRIGKESNRTRQAVFVNLQYKKTLLENNNATETY